MQLVLGGLAHAISRKKQQIELETKHMLSFLADLVNIVQVSAGATFALPSRIRSNLAARIRLTKAVPVKTHCFLFFIRNCQTGQHIGEAWQRTLVNGDRPGGPLPRPPPHPPNRRSAPGGGAALA